MTAAFNLFCSVLWLANGWFHRTVSTNSVLTQLMSSAVLIIHCLIAQPLICPSHYPIRSSAAQAQGDSVWRPVRCMTRFRIPEAMAAEPLSRKREATSCPESTVKP